MLRILSIGHIPTWAGGRQESGLANVIYQLAKHGSQIEGVEVFLAATDVFSKKQMDGKLTIMGWTKPLLIRYILKHPIGSMSCFHALRKLKRKYPTRERLSTLYLKRIFFEKTIKEIQPNIVHMHGASAVWYMDIIPSKCKIAVTFHGMNGVDNNIPHHEVLKKMEHDVFHEKRVDEVFFICTKLVEMFISTYGNNKKRNRVIFNSFDNTRFFIEKKEQQYHQTDVVKARKERVVSLCTVASLSELKGQFRVLYSLASLPNHKDFYYYCIGDDKTGVAEKLVKYANENDLNFKYLGKMNPDDIRKQLYNADYMIMPSSSEGFGITYLEAIACGVPVILPKDIPIALEKDIINQKNSIMLDDCSVESITKVLKQIEQYHFVRDSVALSIAGFSWDDIAKQYIQAYFELL